MTSVDRNEPGELSRGLIMTGLDSQIMESRFVPRATEGQEEIYAGGKRKMEASQMATRSLGGATASTAKLDRLWRETMRLALYFLS